MKTRRSLGAWPLPLELTAAIASLLPDKSDKASLACVSRSTRIAARKCFGVFWGSTRLFVDLENEDAAAHFLAWLAGALRRRRESFVAQHRRIAGSTEIRMPVTREVLVSSAMSEKFSYRFAFVLASLQIAMPFANSLTMQIENAFVLPALHLQNVRDLHICGTGRSMLFVYEQLDLPRVQTLSFRNCALSPKLEFPAASLKSLEIRRCSAHANLSALSRLEHLSIEDTRGRLLETLPRSLKSLAFTGSDTSRFLYIGVGGLDVAKLALENLELSRTNVVACPVAWQLGLAGLRILKVSDFTWRLDDGDDDDDDNIVDHPRLDHMTRLESLVVSQNDPYSCPCFLKHLPGSLKNLEVESIYTISSFDKSVDFSRTPNLLSLRVSSIPRLGIFEDLPRLCARLTSLEFESCNLRQVGIEAFGTQLKFASMVGCVGARIPENFAHLEILENDPPSCVVLSRP